ncbi:MAG: hypothetical protein ACO3EE_04545 [Flavobacteriales bacterium]
MRLLLDVKDSKAAFVMELLNSLSYVKAEPLTPYKSEVLKGVKNGINEVQKISSGKLKGISAKDLLNEL